MKHTISLAIVAALIVTGVLLGLTVGAGGGRQAQETAAVPYPEVWEALAENLQVEVHISLRPLPLSLEERTLDKMAEHADKVQDAVLSVLTPADFTLETSSLTSLFGLVSRSGVEKLSTPPDGIDIVLLTAQCRVPATLVILHD